MPMMNFLVMMMMMMQSATGDMCLTMVMESWSHFGWNGGEYVITNGTGEVKRGALDDYARQGQDVICGFVEGVCYRLVVTPGRYDPLENAWHLGSSLSGGAPWSGDFQVDSGTVVPALCTAAPSLTPVPTARSPRVVTKRIACGGPCTTNISFTLDDAIDLTDARLDVQVAGDFVYSTSSVLVTMPHEFAQKCSGMWCQPFLTCVDSYDVLNAPGRSIVIHFETTDDILAVCASSDDVGANVAFEAVATLTLTYGGTPEPSVAPSLTVAPTSLYGVPRTYTTEWVTWVTCDDVSPCALEFDKIFDVVEAANIEVRVSGNFGWWPHATATVTVGNSSFSCGNNDCALTTCPLVDVTDALRSGGGPLQIQFHVPGIAGLCPGLNTDPDYTLRAMAVLHATLSSSSQFQTTSPPPPINDDGPVSTFRDLEDRSRRQSLVMMTPMTRIEFRHRVVPNATVTFRGGPGIIFDGAYRTGLFLVVANADVTITDVVLRNGWDVMDSGGVAQISDGSTFRLTNCTVEDNGAIFGGAFLVETSSTLLVDATLFRRNIARSGAGVAFLTKNATFHVTRSTFQDNRAEFHHGGVLKLFSSSASVTASTFQGNSALAYGGVFYVKTSTLAITTSSFHGNSASKACQRPSLSHT